MKTDERPLSDHAETRLVRLAGKLLSRSQALEGRIAAIENAAQTCNCARVASEAILDLLSQAANILEKMRHSTDVDARNILSGYFSKILDQIDAVVSECVYDDKNLAMQDSITINTDETRGHGFSIDGIDMSSNGLGLLRFEHASISNSEIIERLITAEQAKNNLAAHSHSYLIISEMLNTHMNFARGMIDILDEGSVQIKNSRAGQDAIAQILSRVFSSVPNNEVATSHSGHSIEDSRPQRERPVSGLPSKNRKHSNMNEEEADPEHGLVEQDAGYRGGSPNLN